MLRFSPGYVDVIARFLFLPPGGTGVRTIKVKVFFFALIYSLQVLCTIHADWSET